MGDGTSAVAHAYSGVTVPTFLPASAQIRLSMSLRMAAMVHKKCATGKRAARRPASTFGAVKEQ